MSKKVKPSRSKIQTKDKSNNRNLASNMLVALGATTIAASGTVAGVAAAAQYGDLNIPSADVNTPNVTADLPEPSGFFNDDKTLALSLAALPVGILTTAAGLSVRED